MRRAIRAFGIRQSRPEFRRYTSHWLAFSSILLAVLLLPAGARAQQTTYTFVGALFNTFEGTACPETCNISGSFTVPQPLPPNLVSPNSIGGSGDFIPSAFSFTDGVTTFTNQNVPLQLGNTVGFSVDTDANGNITLFSFYMTGPGGSGVGMFAYYGGPGNITQEGVNLNAYQAYFEASGARPGGWTVAYSQGNPAWANDPYDEYPGKTMSQKGCAITSLAMSLDVTGTTFDFFLNPGELNSFLTTDGDFTPAHNLDWQAGVNGLNFSAQYNPSGKKLVWRGVNGSSAGQLAAALDSTAEPVIVAVPSIKNCAVVGTATGGHFVLVTGKTHNSNGTYTFYIDDPGCALHKVLSVYPSFATRGYTTDPEDLSGLTLDVDDAAELTLIDPNGKRTGFTVTGNADTYDIPDSYYYRDFITDLDTGVDPTGTSHYLGVTAPSPGKYLVVLTGIQKAPYLLTVKGYSTDGGRQQPVTFSGNVEPGSSISFALSYSSVSGSSVALASIPGDINGDGVVNCVDLDIVKASFGKKAGESGFDPRADVNLDGVVNILDLAAVARQIPAGTTCR